MWHLLSSVKLSSNYNCNSFVLIVQDSLNNCYNKLIINGGHNSVTNIMHCVDNKKWKLM